MADGDPYDLLVIYLKNGGRGRRRQLAPHSPGARRPIRPRRGQYWTGDAVIGFGQLVATMGQKRQRQGVPGGGRRQASGRIYPAPQRPGFELARICRPLCTRRRIRFRVADCLQPEGRLGQSRALLRQRRRRPRPVTGHGHRRRALRSDRPCTAPPRSHIAVIGGSSTAHRLSSLRRGPEALGF